MDKKENGAEKKQLVRRLEIGMFAVIGVLFCVLIALLIGNKIMGTTGGEKPDVQTVGKTDDGEMQEAAAGDEAVRFLAPREGNGFTTMTPEEKTAREKALEDRKKVNATFTISAAGDCVLGTDKKFAKETSLVAKYNEVQDPGYFLGGVKSVFEADDLTIVNMEGTFTELDTRMDKQFAFKGDPSYVEIFTQGSVEAVNLANNHSKDYGIQSFYDTQAVLDGAGIQHFGYEDTVVMEVNGARVGLLGVKGTNCEEELLAGIQNLKDKGAHVIIATFHWGVEREHYPRKNQIELAHLAIDNGVDLIIGHHPHVLQGIEKYKGKYILYSLGNFCFGGNKNPADKDTMIFQQTFTLQDGEVLTDDNINIIPCTISSTDERNDYRPTLATGERAETILGRIEEYSSKFEEQR